MPAYRESKVAPSSSGYPVILFSHGWNGFNAQNTGQALELASHGYVVIGIQHTYGAVVTVFEDGSVAHNNPSALPSGAPNEEYEAAAQKLVDQWAGDMGFALDFMQGQNSDSNSRFFNSLDLARVGVYGHPQAVARRSNSAARTRAAKPCSAWIRSCARSLMRCWKTESHNRHFSCSASAGQMM
jgi:hypothetical protein